MDPFITGKHIREIGWLIGRIAWMRVEFTLPFEKLRQVCDQAVIVFHHCLAVAVAFDEHALLLVGAVKERIKFFLVFAQSAILNFEAYNDRLPKFALLLEVINLALKPFSLAH